MGKRVFTRVAKGWVIVSGASEVEQTGVYSWLLQEDIEIVGVNMSLWSEEPSENDGFASCNLELSQTAEYAQAGAIASVNAGEGWNTAPPGIAKQGNVTVLNFPVGLSVPVKEEGHIYVNAMGFGKTAGDSVFAFEVIIYWVKKGK